jgi:RecA/RadA recombinase
MAQNQWQKLAKRTGLNMLGEGLGSAEFNGYLDTGCYTMNMISSGSLFNGIPNNSFTGIAGESTTGKTFFALAIAKNFMDNVKDAGIYYADSESAVRKAMAENRGMDGMRMVQAEMSTVEEFRTMLLHFLDGYTSIEPRLPLLAILDSLGSLSTNKEMEDTSTFGDTVAAEKKRNTKDMTRPGLIKGSFRVLRLKMATLKIPMIITNHVYANIGGYGPQKEMGGGSGLKYAADTIFFLSKAKAKEGDASDGEVIGSKITIKAVKSRMGRENAQVQALLNYDTGLDKYYGLMEMAEETGVFQKASKGLILPGGTAVSRKEILKNPKQVYTMDILKAIDEAARPLFTYGSENSLPYVAPEDELETEEAM